MATGQSELRQIRDALYAWDQRLRVQQSIVWLPRGLVSGLLLAVGVAVAARIWPLLLLDRLIMLSGVLMLIGMTAALLGVWAWPRTPIQLARRFDRLFGLRERVSTALEVADGTIPVESQEIAALQRADTARVVRTVRAKQALPLHADWREWAVALIVLGGLALALFLPNPQEEVVAGRAQVQEAIAEEIETLEQMREQALEDPALTEEQRAAVVEELDQALETLTQRGVTQEEALAALDQAERTLREMDQQAAQERQQALDQIGDLMEQSGAAQALQQGDTSAAAEQLAEALSGLSPDEQQALADQLEASADALEAINPELAEALREAAEALRSGDVQGAAESLAEAGEQMPRTDEGAPQQSLEQYADRLQEGQDRVAGAGRSHVQQPGQAGQGQSVPGQPGQSGMGQAQPGGQQGQGQTGGGEGYDPGQVAGDRPRGGGAPDGGETPYDDIYAPQRIGGEGGEQMGVPTGPGVPVDQGGVTDSPTGQSTVPYTDVWGDYSGAVNQALDSGYIPLGMRAVIQQYFSRLAPED